MEARLSVVIHYAMLELNWLMLQEIPGMAKILDGTALAKEIRAEVAVAVAEMQGQYEATPGLAAVLVGDDPASGIYVRNKGRACAEIEIGRASCRERV